MPFTRINSLQAKSLMTHDRATVVDVRDADSYRAGHIEDAVHVDAATVDAFIANADHQAPLIVCCYRGHMSQGAADYFNQRGFAHTYSLDGGFNLWAKST